MHRTARNSKYFVFGGLNLICRCVNFRLYNTSLNLRIDRETLSCVVYGFKAHASVMKGNCIIVK